MGSPLTMDGVGECLLTTKRQAGLSGSGRLDFRLAGG